MVDVADVEQSDVGESITRRPFLTEGGEGLLDLIDPLERMRRSEQFILDTSLDARDVVDSAIVTVLSCQSRLLHPPRFTQQRAFVFFESARVDSPYRTLGRHLGSFAQVVSGAQALSVRHGSASTFRPGHYMVCMGRTSTAAHTPPGMFTTVLTPTKNHCPLGRRERPLRVTF